MMDRIESMPLGIVVERRDSSHPWQDHHWLPVAVIPGAAPMDPAGPWRVLDQGKGWVRYLAGTLTLELFRSDTEGYRYNLSTSPPAVYVVLREATDSEHEVVPFAVTVSPYEGQDFLDTGEDIVEGVPMPEGLLGWVAKYVEIHHVDQPFRKRRQRRRDDGETSAEPPGGGRNRDAR